MSQHIEWGTGIGDFTVLPGQWVDAYGSRNNGPAIWSGYGDGIIIEWPDRASAVAQLRAYADAIEAAPADDRPRDACAGCLAEVVQVPETMAEDDFVWEHLAAVTQMRGETLCGDPAAMSEVGDDEDADDDDDA